MLGGWSYPGHSLFYRADLKPRHEIAICIPIPTTSVNPYQYNTPPTLHPLLVTHLHTPVLSAVPPVLHQIGLNRPTE